VKTLAAQVQHAVAHMIEKSEPISHDNTIRRALATGNISVRSLARIADLLNFEVVLMVRRKP